MEATTAAEATTATSPKLPSGYALHVGLPQVPTYRHMRIAAGLTSVTEAQASRAISGTWYGCHIRYAAPQQQQQQQQQPADTTADQVVGMGRIISDGGWYFHIADMAVLPDHQRRGLGAAIMRELLAYIERNRPDEGTPYINLLADPPGIGLYKKTGFVDSSNLCEHGMVWVGGSYKGAHGFVNAGEDADKRDGGS
ncbi:GNAT family N-acetyltransferase [Magnaporthiopsis poae ATCC 64411]|uniref:GNAT family N-acetyltransferase n=1 Tax=Magnaporthiopsis poae (strain ATCC 64411 / 73-15) TaxID=644358 RepID=A0A0C4ECD1_MAGP6|nr:GNAT family N-acetyltransferase [Magnaporthiopsis poae ATCC 64411]